MSVSELSAVESEAVFYEDLKYPSDSRQIFTQLKIIRNRGTGTGNCTNCALARSFARRRQRTLLASAFNIFRIGQTLLLEQLL